MKKLFLTLVACLFTSQAFAATYTIDPGHSSLGFAVKHMEAGKTRGHFNDYSGTINYDPADYATFSADVKINAASIDTNLEARDNHLRNPDFLDVEKNPEITFKSTRLEKRGEAAAIIGDLTIKGVTKEITIPATISGSGSIIGISGFTIINRKDYGVSWNKNLDNGGFVVGNDVELVIEIEAKQEEAKEE